MNVLSLFDGISCGQIALERAGIQVDKYYASEINKYAIKITQKNFPDTIQLGDVQTVRGSKLPRIDLLIGGSPCQGFSFAGKQLNFEDPRSKLFFEYARILKEVKPKYFLLENVKMKKQYRDVISEMLNIEPIEINSALVSAQNRERLYWTNIPNVKQPEDKRIFLRDIIKNDLDADDFKGGNLKSYFAERKKDSVFNGLVQIGKADFKGHDCIKRVYDIMGKAPTLTTMGGGHREPKIAVSTTEWRRLTPLECERLQTLPDNYTEGLTNTQRYKCIGNGWTVDVIAYILSHIGKKLYTLPEIINSMTFN